MEEREKGTSSLVMIRTLAGISALSGLLIVVAVQATTPTIKLNKAEMLKKSVFEVLPGISSFQTFKLEDDRLILLQGEDEKAVKLFIGYDQDHALKGIAVEASGQGFADVIRVLYGYDPSKQAVIAMKVLESKETPGLGDKIYTDANFAENFKALDVKLDSSRTHLANPIEVVKHGEKQNPWQIDAITGATISSKAVGKLLNQSAQEKLPIIVKNMDTLQGGGR